MKTLAITGPTSGIGKETVKGLVRHFDKIFLLARNQVKATQLIQSFSENDQQKLVFVHMDLTDMDSVQQAANVIKAKIDKLSVLINNAGGLLNKEIIPENGFEKTFATNHLGHFLLTLLLMPLLLKDQQGKVIQVSSEVHRMAVPNFNDIEMKSFFVPYIAYANSKLYNILFTKSLVEKYGDKGLKAVALHPGIINSNLGKKTLGFFALTWKLIAPFMSSPENGAKTPIFLAKNNIHEDQNGYYYKKEKPIKPSGAARSKRYREKLWQYSEEKIKPWLK